MQSDIRNKNFLAYILLFQNFDRNKFAGAMALL